MIASYGTILRVAGDDVRKAVLNLEDNASLPHALCVLFKRKEDFDVCEIADNRREVNDVEGRLRPDLIVLDLLRPENGLDAARAMRRVLPNVSLVLCRAPDDGLSGHARLTGISEIESGFDPPSMRLKKARALLDIQVGG